MTKDHSVEALSTDVLVIGGGPAGTWAAIKAAEAGTDVILADKGYTGAADSGSATSRNCPRRGSLADIAANSGGAGVEPSALEPPSGQRFPADGRPTT